MNAFLTYFLHIWQKIEQDILSKIEATFEQDFVAVKAEFSKVCDYINEVFKSVEEEAVIDWQAVHDEFSKLFGEFETLIHNISANQFVRDMSMVLSEITSLIFILKAAGMPLLLKGKEQQK